MRERLPSRDGIVIEICGFGPISAAARAAQLVAHYRPEQVLLLGLAGTYVEQLTIGSAYEFSEVACYGVGCGLGDRFQIASAMGWHQWSDTNSPQGELTIDSPPPSIDDRILLASAADTTQLLTCCAASDNHQEVAQKLACFPQACAEDMEGFGIAMACQLSSTPLRIVRGISNQAGIREKQTWKIAEALEAVTHLARSILLQ